MRDVTGTRGRVSYYMSHNALITGHYADARVFSESAHDIAEALGDVASRRAPAEAETATSHDGAALALANELRMRPLVAHCHLGLGRLDRRTGQPDRAREHLAAAAMMYREMDMRFWLDQVEAELAR
jgi:hypothetical protein